MSKCVHGAYRQVRRIDEHGELQIMEFCRVYRKDDGELGVDPQSDEHVFARVVFRRINVDNRKTSWRFLGEPTSRETWEEWYSVLGVYSISGHRDWDLVEEGDIILAEECVSPLVSYQVPEGLIAEIRERYPLPYPLKEEVLV